MIIAQQVKHYAHDKDRIEHWCETTLQDAILERAKSSSVNQITVYSVDLPNCYLNEDVQIYTVADYVRKWGYTTEVIYKGGNVDSYAQVVISW